MNLFLLDFETTGLNPYLNDIIEIAIKKYNEGEYYQSLVKPKRLPPGLVSYIPPHITEITKITDSMIVNNSTSKINAVYNMFKYIHTYSEEGPIYILSHNGNSFDFIIFRKIIFDYLNMKKFKNFKYLSERFRYIDTLLLAKLFTTDKERVSQPKLCKKYEIINKEEHRALGDIIALEKLYSCLCKVLENTMKVEEDSILKNPEEIIQRLYIV